MPRDPSKPRKAPEFYCRCEECQCDAKTPHPTKVCYTCRGGEGVALFPTEPAHHRERRKWMPKLEPVK